MNNPSEFKGEKLTYKVKPNAFAKTRKDIVSKVISAIEQCYSDMNSEIVMATEIASLLEMAHAKGGKRK